MFSGEGGGAVMSISIIVRRLVLLLAATLAFTNAHASERDGFSPRTFSPRTFSPSAPVRIDYTLPDPLPASDSVTVPLQLSTPLRAGHMHFEVVSSEGLTVQSAAYADFDLRRAEQPFVYDLTVVLGAAASRYLVVLVSVDGPIGSQSRSYRIDFSAAAPAATPADARLKLLPSTAPQ
jgi:hypothetical protein